MNTMESNNNNDTILEGINLINDYSLAMAAGDHKLMATMHSSDYELDFVQRDAFQGGRLSAEEAHQFWSSWFAGFSEMDYEVVRTIAGEDVIVTQWIFTGTNDGKISPPVFDDLIDPTGRTICFRGVSIYDIQEGKIQRETTYMDLGTVLVELGVML